MLKSWFRIKLWQRVLGALVAGVLFGLLFGQNTSVGIYLIDLTGFNAMMLKPIGDIFLNAIKLLVVPLIFVTLVSGVTSMDHPEGLGRVGLKAFGLYLATTAFAISLGLGFGALFQPGNGLDMSGIAAPEPPEQISFIERLVNLVPTNPFEAFASGDVLQIIVFSLLIGIGIIMAGEVARPLKTVIEAGSEVMLKITHIVMELAPFGVFALIAWVVANPEYGLSALENLGLLIITLYLACLTHIVLVYGGIIRLIARLPLVRFFRGILDAQAVAYSTASSSATLPVTISCARDNLGVDKSTSGFVLPLGATINMDGTALYMGIAALFTAQAFGIDLSAGDYVTIILTSTLASIGAAGVPGAGLIMMGIVFGAVGLPLETIALVAGVDRIMDMMRTMTNVTGDAMVSVLVSKSEGTLDEETFRTPAVV